MKKLIILSLLLAVAVCCWAGDCNCPCCGNCMERYQTGWVYPINREGDNHVYAWRCPECGYDSQSRTNCRTPEELAQEKERQRQLHKQELERQLKEIQRELRGLR